MLDTDKPFELINFNADQTAWSSLWVTENTPENTSKSKDEFVCFQSLNAIQLQWSIENKAEEETEYSSVAFSLRN